MARRATRILCLVAQSCGATAHVFSSVTHVACFITAVWTRHTPFLHADVCPSVGQALREVSEVPRLIRPLRTLHQSKNPDLAMGRHTRFKDCSLEEFREAARTHVRVMNEAVADIPADRLRTHVCWGNYPGPHHHDVPLADVVDIVFTSKPKYVSIEACNPGHGHEWEVFEKYEMPADKVVMPGVLDTTTSHIEHPRLVAQRLMNYVRLVGSQRVIACTDCGFSTAAGAMNVPTEIVYAKLKSMVEGARIASQMAKAEQAKNDKITGA